MSIKTAEIVRYKDNDAQAPMQFEAVGEIEYQMDEEKDIKACFFSHECRKRGWNFRFCSIGRGDYDALVCVS